MIPERRSGMIRDVIRESVKGPLPPNKSHELKFPFSYVCHFENKHIYIILFVCVSLYLN